MTFVFSPFVEVRDLGGLLSSNGFSMLTIDTDDLKVVWNHFRAILHQHYFLPGSISVHVPTFCGLERNGRE